ncbi:hypothetical protein RFI_06502 [Reticulomyxa filosa]|uniref:Ubiquitin-like domain-containing protein n=1 Tax=Reticulomyxa filosa TaxID=46433 RepID=X6NXR7_RETFI|nr:hypothetical protein RFI_06502 [Reticulomyxa filosa]|eukprot:ETO30619.1 hypothetical protein RFI_06502 [Reticulomyxa filosa]
MAKRCISAVEDVVVPEAKCRKLSSGITTWSSNMDTEEYPRSWDKLPENKRLCFEGFESTKYDEVNMEDKTKSSKFVYIQTLRGKVVKVSLPNERVKWEDIKISDLKHAITDTLSVPFDNQVLIYASQVLLNGQTFQKYGIRKGDCLHFSLK